MRIASYFVWRALRPFVLLSGAGLAIGAGLQSGSGPQTKPVFIGGDTHFHACSTLGAVAGLEPKPGNYLALRNRPGTDGKRLAKLRNDQPLWLCADDGAWVGVVIPQQGTDCGVNLPLSARQPYKGPCTSGWVFGKFVEAVAS